MGRVWNQPASLTIGEQVEFLKHCLADENFVAEHQRLFKCVAPQHFEDDRPRDIDGFLATVGVFGDALSTNGDAQFFSHMDRHDGPDGAGIDERIGFVGADRIGLDFARPRPRFVNGVC